MNRLLAGMLVGIVGGIATVLFILNTIGILTLLVGLLAGVIIGFLVTRSPAERGKTGSAALIAGLIAGAFLLVASIGGTYGYYQLPTTQTRLNQNQQTAVAQATQYAATATPLTEPGAPSSITSVDANATELGYSYTIAFVVGLLNLIFVPLVSLIAGTLIGRRQSRP